MRRRRKRLKTYDTDTLLTALGGWLVYIAALFWFGLGGGDS